MFCPPIGSAALKGLRSPIIQIIISPQKGYCTSIVARVIEPVFFYLYRMHSAPRIPGRVYGTSSLLYLPTIRCLRFTNVCLGRIWVWYHRTSTYLSENKRKRDTNNAWKNVRNLDILGREWKISIRINQWMLEPFDASSWGYDCGCRTLIFVFFTMDGTNSNPNPNPNLHEIYRWLPSDDVTGVKWLKKHNNKKCCLWQLSTGLGFVIAEHRMSLIPNYMELIFFALFFSYRGYVYCRTGSNGIETVGGHT